MLDLIVDGIPPELRRQPFTLWRASPSPDGKKPAKVPFRVDEPERRASSTDPSTWASFEDAVDAYGLLSAARRVHPTLGPIAGIAVVLTAAAEIFCLDLDRVLDGERLDPRAAALVDAFGTFTEISPSGSGLHLFGRGHVPAAIRGDQVELYGDRRVICLTGHRWQGTPFSLEPCQPWLDRLRESPVPRRPYTGPATPPPDDLGGALLGRVHAWRLAIAGPLKPWADGYLIELARCPWSETHTAGPGRGVARDPRKRRVRFRLPTRALLRALVARFAQRHRVGVVIDLDAAAAQMNGPKATSDAEYLEPLSSFLAEDDPPMLWLFPELLPVGVTMLLHGEPRARKSLAAFELALAAATGTAPFGLARLAPAEAVDVLYVQEEDSRPLTRQRLRRIVHERCAEPPSRCYVAVRRGINLDDPAWIARLTADIRHREIRLVILDAARRLSRKTDEGPVKVSELMAALRGITRETGASLVIVHHDVKPARDGQDQRRRSQRASGGDWFAACECPVSVERLSATESLVFPEDYKFGHDPAPFTFTTLFDGAHIRKLVGKDTTSESAERAGARGKLLAWLRTNGPAAKTAMKRAGFGWETLEPLLDALLRDGLIDAAPGRTANSLRYFVQSEPSGAERDGSAHGAGNAS